MARPRPIWPLKLRLGIAPGAALFVRALLGREDVAAMYDPNVTEKHSFLVSGRIARQLIATALCGAKGKPMLTYDDTGNMTEDELFPLAMHVIDGLNTISPAAWRCNIVQWKKRLRLGAQHFTNMGDTITMAESGDIISGSGERQYSPDRYFGCSLRDLTDGQLMAYDAALIAYREMGNQKA